jgi:hypothetical protein
VVSFTSVSPYALRIRCLRQTFPGLASTGTFKPRASERSGLHEEYRSPSDISLSCKLVGT